MIKFPVFLGACVGMLIIFVGLMFSQTDNHMHEIQSRVIALEMRVDTLDNQIQFLKGYNKLHDDWIVDLYICFGNHTIDADQTVNIDEARSCFYQAWMKMAQAFNDIHGQLPQ